MRMRKEWPWIHLNLNFFRASKFKINNNSLIKEIMEMKCVEKWQLSMMVYDYLISRITSNSVLKRDRNNYDYEIFKWSLLISWLYYNVGSFANLLGKVKWDISNQARKEGVKGVTVSRGPGRKRGPGYHEIKRNSFILGPKFAGF